MIVDAMKLAYILLLDELHMLTISAQLLDGFTSLKCNLLKIYIITFLVESCLQCQETWYLVAIQLDGIKGKYNQS